jgi:type III pantothenate kinase
MLLTVDVGNTNIKLGVFENEICRKLFRISTAQKRTSDEMGILMKTLITDAEFDAKQITDAIIASVVPDVTMTLVGAVRNYFSVEPLLVSLKMNFGIAVPNVPDVEIGADRLVNCVTVRGKFQSAVIIADYGTAIKYDVLSAKSEFITGITAPGVEICADALFEKAALLGKVELRIPDSIIAADTAESIQAGILYGKIGEAEYIINRLKKELCLPDAKVIATGGFAEVIAKGTNIFDFVDPFLTLKGLKILYDENR